MKKPLTRQARTDVCSLPPCSTILSSTAALSSRLPRRDRVGGWENPTGCCMGNGVGVASQTCAESWALLTRSWAATGTSCGVLGQRLSGQQDSSEPISPWPGWQSLPRHSCWQEGPASSPAIAWDRVGTVSAEHKPQIGQSQVLFTFRCTQAGQTLLSSCAVTFIAWEDEFVPEQWRW